MPSMRACGRRFAIAAILLICLGSLVAEMCDRWDQTFQDDTESRLTLVALCVGMALSLPGIVLARVRQLSNSRFCPAAFDPIQSAPAWLANPIPSSRPPTTLRV